MAGALTANSKDATNEDASHTEVYKIIQQWNQMACLLATWVLPGPAVAPITHQKFDYYGMKALEIRPEDVVGAGQSLRVVVLFHSIWQDKSLEYSSLFQNRWPVFNSRLNGGGGGVWRDLMAYVTTVALVPFKCPPMGMKYFIFNDDRNERISLYKIDRTRVS